MLSQRARYALKALLALAEAGTGSPLMISAIARRQRIPHKFLALILLDLKRGGMVQSRRGREGGYLLAKPPSRIFFGQVIRLIDGPVALLSCVSKTQYRRCSDCPSERSCPIHRLLTQVRASTSAILDSRSLQDELGLREPVVKSPARRPLRRAADANRSARPASAARKRLAHGVG
ncbi:MAG: Rrf2 family transcriptional regulator [Steroidobacteraceae bacterium]